MAPADYSYPDWEYLVDFISELNNCCHGWPWDWTHNLRSSFSQSGAYDLSAMVTPAMVTPNLTAEWLVWTLQTLLIVDTFIIFRQREKISIVNILHVFPAIQVWLVRHWTQVLSFFFFNLIIYIVAFRTKICPDRWQTVLCFMFWTSNIMFCVILQS